MNLSMLFKRNILIHLATLPLVLGVFTINAQEFETSFEIPKIEVLPGLSRLNELQGGSFTLQVIDLSVDLRLQTLRSKNTLDMRMPTAKITSKFKSPILEKPPKRDKAIQFTTENNRHERPQNDYHSFFRSQRHPLPRAIYGNPRL